MYYVFRLQQHKTNLIAGHKNNWKNGFWFWLPCRWYSFCYEASWFFISLSRFKTRKVFSFIIELSSFLKATLWLTCFVSSCVHDIFCWLRIAISFLSWSLRKSRRFDWRNVVATVATSLCQLEKVALWFRVCGLERQCPRLQVRIPANTVRASESFYPKK